MWGVNDNLPMERARSERADLERQLLAADSARADLVRAQEAAKAEFEAKIAQMNAQMGPLRQALARAEEAVWTMGLYTCEDAEVIRVRDGEPALRDVPVVVRQRVLVMSEEAAVVGLDFESVRTFIDWVAEDISHVDRVAPEAKSVVALVPTRVESTTGDVFHDAVANDENARAWWLVRNGGRVDIVRVDPRLRIVDRILPNEDEFQREFGRGLWGNAQPGSAQWLKAEERAEGSRRHYMRILMLLQGFSDNLHLWDPVPADFSFLSMGDRGSSVVLLKDADSAHLLGEKRETFGQFRARLASRMRPGVRVIGDFGWSSREFSDLRVPGTQWSAGYHPRLSPGNAQVPPSATPLLIEGRRDGDLFVRYERGGEINWQTGGSFHNRASCVIRPKDRWVLAFDLASREELALHLDSREDRSAWFMEMVPVLRAAIDVKDREAEEESDFRDLLAGHVGQENVGRLIDWYKTANAWFRPLHGNPEMEAKAFRAIVRRHEDEQAASADAFSAQAVDLAKSLGAIMVGRDRAGKFLAYTPSADDPDAVFVDVTTITRTRGVGGTSTEVLPSVRAVASLVTIWEAPEWKTWPLGVQKSTHVSPSRRASVVEELSGEDVWCITETRSDVWRRFTVWCDHDSTVWEVRGDGLEKVGSGSGRVWTWTHRDPGDRWLSISLPYMPADSGGTGPRLVWSSALMEDWIRNEWDAERAKSDARKKRDAETSRRVRVFASFIDRVRESEERRAHERFVADYGTQAEDIWPAKRADYVRTPPDAWTLAMRSSRAPDGLPLSESVSREGFGRQETWVFDEHGSDVV